MIPSHYDSAKKLAAANTELALAGDELERLRARVAELEGALKPFVAEADTWLDHVDDDAQIYTGADECRDEDCDCCSRSKMTLGDLRRARALLSRSEEQTEAALNLALAEAEGDNDYIAECCDDAGSPRTSDDGEITIGIVGRVEWMRDRIAELREELAASRRNEAASGGADE